MSVAFDPWTTTSGGGTATRDRTYPKSLVDRAKRRISSVRRVSGRRWVVEQDPKLGDVSTHEVELAVDGSYGCSCFEESHGESRRARGCSHVLAVTLSREEIRGQRRSPSEEVSGPPSVAESTRPALPSPIEEGTRRVSWAGQAGPEPEGTGLPRPSVPEARDDVPGVDDPMWTRRDDEPLPAKFEEIRDEQWDAVREVQECFARGEKVVWLDGPTGSGKTLIGEMVRRLEADRAFYICHSKTLQEQMVADFHYARVLKGRSNYPTLNGPSDATCGDCTASGADDDCLWCTERGACPYEVAKIDAIRAKLAVVNTAYFLNEWNYVGRVGRERELGIIDECDTLEGELMGFVEFRVGERLLSAAGVDAPKEGSHRTTIRKWLEDELQPALKDLRAGIRGEDLRAIRDRQRVNRVISDLTRVVARETDDEGLDGWVRDNRAGPMVLKPVVVDEWGQKNVWRHSEKWLCMSATVISPDELARSNGIEDGKWGLVQVPMTFPVENRQVIVAPVADMGRKGRDAGEWEYAVRAVERICERHPGDRVLVHTVSYDLAKFLKERVNLRRKVIIYTEGSRRDAALEEFRRSKAGVLLAASMDRGVDLAGDECRVVIVAKVPFPNLGDRQVGERMRVEGGGVWYSVQAVRKLVQMTGRAVRSRDDWAVSYVIDRQFVSNVWKKSRGLLPKWWVEALVWDFPVRELMTP